MFDIHVFCIHASIIKNKQFIIGISVGLQVFAYLI